MELNQLGVADPRSGQGGQPEGVPGVLIAPGRCVPPDAGMSACGQDHRIGVDLHRGAVHDVESICAEDGAVSDEQPCDVDGVDDWHVQLCGPAHQRALDLQAGVVPCVGGAAIFVGAEEAL
ncbi:hypothetical protein D3C73_1120010 [compost metagenome]